MRDDKVIDKIEIFGTDINLVFEERSVDLDKVTVLVRLDASDGSESGSHGTARGRENTWSDS